MLEITNILILFMSTKKILVEKSERGIVARAIENSVNERLDILGFVAGASVGGGLGEDSFACGVEPDYRAYADSTYVKK